MDRIAVEPGYESLAAVLDEALMQAQAGKGKERHASGEPFDEQLICRLCREDGIGFATGQAKKKTTESHRLAGEFGVKELLGAINYLAAAVIVRREEEGYQIEGFDESTEAPAVSARQRFTGIVADAIMNGRLMSVDASHDHRVTVEVGMSGDARAEFQAAFTDLLVEASAPRASRPL